MGCGASTSGTRVHPSKTMPTLLDTVPAAPPSPSEEDSVGSQMVQLPAGSERARRWKSVNAGCRSSWESLSEPTDLPEGVPKEPNRLTHEDHVRSVNTFRVAVEMCPETFTKIMEGRRSQR